MSKLRDLEASGGVRAQAAEPPARALVPRGERAADVNVASEAKDGSHRGSGGDGSGQGGAGLRSGGSRAPWARRRWTTAPGPRGAPEEEEDESPSTSAALAGMDYVRLLGAALQKSRERQSEVGADPGGARPLGPPGADPARGEDAGPPEHGAPVRLADPALPPHARADTGDVSLVTHKDYSRVNTVHEEKFWRCHEQSAPSSSTPRRCPRTG